ncbi:MAG TPA: hypothetical protein VHO06_06425 [Polyangia bacterium]|nr:hypothetical protein [Polyangia bacterium]
MFRLSLSLPSLVLALAVWVVPRAGTAAPSKSSLSGWAKAKHGKVLVPSKAPPPSHAPRTEAAAVPAKAASKPVKTKSDGPAVNGKVAVLGFTGEGAAHVQQAVVSTLRTRGLQVTTGLRPVDTAEQYREMAATLQLAAYIDGTVGGAGSRGQATVRVRSGVTGRRIASIHFSGERGALAADVGSGLWPRTGSQLTRLCAAAAKPRKGARRAMRIDAGTPLENTAPDDYIPPHLRNDPPKDRQKEDPWADEGT